jgi:hypothetical protein
MTLIRKRWFNDDRPLLYKLGSNALRRLSTAAGNL